MAWRSGFQRVMRAGRGAAWRLAGAAGVLPQPGLGAGVLDVASVLVLLVPPPQPDCQRETSKANQSKCRHESWASKEGDMFQRLRGDTEGRLKLVIGILYRFPRALRQPNETH